MGQYYHVVTKHPLGRVQAYNRNVIVNGKEEYTMAKLMEHSWWKNDFVSSICNDLHKYGPMQIAWIGDYADEFKWYKTAWNDKVKQKSIKCNPLYLDGFYLVDHTKKQFIDCSKYYSNCINNEWCIHPLPLLTACGNGRGGGDYHGTNNEMVGYWAYDLIGVEDKAPNNYTDITSDVIFKEEW